MKDTAQLTLRVGDDVVGKLAELAGGKEQSGEFLTKLVRLLHNEQQNSSGNDLIERAISAYLLQTDRDQKDARTIRTLRTRLRRLTESQRELLATIRLLSQSSNESKSQKLQ